MSDSASHIAAESECRPRKRRHLRAPPKPLQITARDAFVIHRVFLSRLCSSQATYVFARTADPEGGGDNWSRRLRVLYDGGFLTRLYLPQSRYLGGSQWPVYCVESGVAAAAAELRQPWRAIDRKTRRRLLARTAGTRQRVLELLVSESHMPVELIESALRANTEFALRLYSGERCHVSHALLASTFAAILWFGFSRLGIAVEHIFPEGAVDLAEGVHSGTPLLPDSFFVAGRTAVAVEAETGASSRNKILEKVRRYSAVGATPEFFARIGVSYDRLLVIFHCATTAHVRLVSDVIAQEYPRGSDLFLVSHADAFHLEYSHVHFRRNLPVEDAAAEIHLYDVLASLVTRALFAQVEGLADGRAVLGYVPISGACDVPLGERGEA